MVFLLPVSTDLIICSYTYLNTALKIWTSISQIFKTPIMYISRCYFGFSCLGVEQIYQRWTPNWTFHQNLLHSLSPLRLWHFNFTSYLGQKYGASLWLSFRKLLTLPWKYKKNPIVFPFLLLSLLIISLHFWFESV